MTKEQLMDVVCDDGHLMSDRIDALQWAYEIDGIAGTMNESYVEAYMQAYNIMVMESAMCDCMTQVKH